jgi:hypothetical protein
VKGGRMGRVRRMGCFGWVVRGERGSGRRADGDEDAEGKEECVVM